MQLSPIKREAGQEAPLVMLARQTQGSKQPPTGSGMQMEPSGCGLETAVHRVSREDGEGSVEVLGRISLMPAEKKRWMERRKWKT